MTSTIKVDTIQTAAGAVPTIGDLGINNSGTVVQVVDARFTTASGTVTTSTNQNATVASGKYADITPTSTSNKILILTTFNLQWAKSGSIGGSIWSVRRNGTSILDASGYDFLEYTSVDTNMHRTVSLNYVDSPSSTSSLRYEIYLGNYNNGSTTLRDWGGGTMTLMEIAG